MAAARSHRWLRWPENTAGRGSGRKLAYGADYNPEQWPREVWDEDVRLMREAGVNIVSLGVFSWARIQPGPDEWDFAWLDEVMDLLHANGIAVDLATATASPPPWLTTLHPEILPVTAAGETVWPGARQHWRPTSPVFRTHALRLAETVARRYADHPALTAWHISNELGCHNVYDYSGDAAAAFRIWLRERYGTVERLNTAWGTAFWSQHYTGFDQVLPPRLAASHPNPTQQLDFKRFSSDALKEYLRAERAVLESATPDVPITTNFMVMGETRGMNYADWAAEVDFVSNDHYVRPGAQALDELSFSANLTGNIAGGRPWFLMEHSTSAVNWQPVNRAKAPGELARDSLLHVAHGADAVCFFQWRQSAAGAEKYHSAMVPHAGPESAVFRAVADLGRRLEELAPLAGSHRKPAPVAILFDWESWWASEQDSHPSSLLRYRQEALDWYSAMLARGVRADVVPLGTPLEHYRMVVAPILHMVGEDRAKELVRYTESGGHLVATYFSAVVDENDHAWLGGYPGPLRDLLGLRIEEFVPLLPDEEVRLDDGSAGTLWSDDITVTDPQVEVLASYADGPRAGQAAITRRSAGAGSAAYVSTRLGAQGLTGVAARLLAKAGVAGELPPRLRGSVELAVRADAASEYWFVVNRTAEPVDLADLGGEPIDPADAPEGGAGVLPPRGAAVLRRPTA
ncbi:beta-galactosidase [Streptomonospora wellingtoniae]|uniref:Beta-galactosidase n=1 Tax=Streptomonospora wellingtoniae TaxID=3075544 RepID=A0ABU2KV70_9ACTN|nr:beta-galactosidase [Streptomonospora sp. DSM 45055]MDT0303028.1 beta-galactosidase [Streptomonospora sp. DSM 45055]